MSYWDFCSEDSFNISQIRSKFYSAGNIRIFVMNHASVNKKLLITHFNKIINTVYNSNDDLTIPNIQVNLQARSDFSELLPSKKSSNNKKVNGALPLTMDQLLLI